MEETQEEKEIRFFHANLVKFLQVLSTTKPEVISKSLKLIPNPFVRAAISKLSKVVW